MPSTMMLEVGDLTVAYGPHRALEGVSISVSQAEICVILGANGAGKSTLLKAIAGMVRPQPGARISINGRDVSHEKPDRIVKAGLALVPEGRGIFGDLTVAENLQLGAYGSQARDGESTRLRQVYELFPRLGERKSQVARTMSGGEQQMVAIGRALMSNPKILMLDEPSLGLSPILTKDLFKSLKAVRETGVGILLVEQNAKQSLAIADRGYLLENGHIIGENSAEALAKDPAVQAAYLGGAASKHAPVRAPAARKPVPAIAARAPETDGPPKDVAAMLAERAARIQRDYLDDKYGRARQKPVNGTHYEKIASHAPDGGEPIAAKQALELGRQASRFAERAREIQTGHLAEIRRKTSIWTILSRADWQHEEKN